MKKKRILWRILLGVLAAMAGLLTGCKTKIKEENQSQAIGRYVESEISLPEDISVPLSIVYQEGNLVLYTYLPEKESYQSYQYEKENGNWSNPKEETWLNQEKVREVCLGNDKRIYAVTEAVSGLHILRLKEDGEKEDISSEIKTDGENLGFADMVILKDATIGIGNYKNSMIEFYKNEENVFSTEGISIREEEQTMFQASEDTIAVLGANGNSIEFYDAESFEKKNTIEAEQDLSESMLVSGEDGSWYFVNTKGIYRVVEDGSMVENIMDGKNGTMSNPVSWFLRRFIEGEKAQFYGLYSKSGQEWKLIQYVFDSDAKVPEKILSVYSLKENRTVLQAVYEFKRQYPEVQVEYNTAVTGEESPTSDHIRTLNTELLGQSGADVLILDGLPIESYIEKGVLADLSETAKDLEDMGVLKNVIQNTAQKDGEIYAVPARLSVPILFGTQEEVDACQNMEAMKFYAQKNQDRRLFGVTSHDLIGMTMFHMFYDELSKEDGSLDEEKLLEFILTWQQICTNGNLQEYEKKYFGGDSIWSLLDASFCSSQVVLGEKVYANVSEIKGLKESMTSYTSAKGIGSLLTSFKEYYVPKTIAGVNASSKQQDLATEFIKCLFKEEVQQIDSWDGFSVLSSVLDTFPEYVDSQEAKKEALNYQGKDWDTDEIFEVTLTYPSREETENLIKMIKELKDPFIQDRILSDTVQQELEKCYAQKQSPEETAKSIGQKVGTYLLE